VRVITKRRLKEFWELHANAEAPLRTWYRLVNSKSLDWTKFADVRATFNSVDQVGSCLVFNIGGNNYRLIAKVNYRWKIVYVRKIMTHGEYDKGQWPEECGCD